MKTAPIESPFHEFLPVYWDPSHPDLDQESGLACSVRRDHGVRGSFRLHNQRDAINEGRSFLDKVIVEYRIGRISYNLFTVRDFFEVGYAFDPKAAGNIMGDVAERIARRVTKYFLKHHSPNGHTGGIFDRRFDPANRNDFVIAHNEEYVLKIQKYPNVVILRHTGRGKFGYENIKELDGLFDYRQAGHRHILVLESKIDKLNVDCGDLVHHLFTPLRALFPEAKFHYILFSDASSIYNRRELKRARQLRPIPILIHERLREEGVGTLFLTFNETNTDFERIKEHLITQYRASARMGVTLHGRTEITPKKITVFDDGETPHLKLIKDARTGMWREVRLTHKRVRDS